MQLTNLIATAALAGLTLAAPAPVEKRQGFQGQYTAIAHRPGAPFHGKELQAAGLHIFVGASGPAAYCPTSVGSACPNATDTVFAGGSMWVEVPGGQQGFTQTSGAWAYTQAHSAYEPDYLESAPSAAANGKIAGAKGEGLTACPVEGQEGVYQVFVEVEGFNQTHCTCFTARAKAWGSTNFGAWQYT
ncbi:hypothetical protein K461DRAFT_279611 [Myriangium duriaei CBS 260.36]|uniref:Uncharacterized protein n=1 Tax=Myriangium duriaei CBS 260.36 TaxID=1168546 RepID=A0A9P4IYU5_9PEZI|nr:hypothetical protein K461DRAFT_279611 [Myriangium duriaei CBS 260.36]